MTNKEAKEKLYMEWQKFLEDNIDYAGVSEAYKMAFKALEQESCDNIVNIKLEELFERVENIEKQIKEDKEEQLKKLKAEVDYAKFRCTL